MCQCLSRTVVKITALPRISLTLLREGSQGCRRGAGVSYTELQLNGVIKKERKEGGGNCAGRDTWREGRVDRKGKDWRQRKGTQEREAPFSKNKQNLVTGCVRVLTG